MYVYPTSNDVDFSISTITYTNATSNDVNFDLTDSQDFTVYRQSRITAPSLATHVLPSTTKRIAKIQQPDRFYTALTAQTIYVVKRIFEPVTVLPYRLYPDTIYRISRLFAGRSFDSSVPILSVVSKTQQPKLAFNLPANTLSEQQANNQNHNYYIVYRLTAPTLKRYTSIARPFGQKAGGDYSGYDARWIEDRSGDQNGFSQSYAEPASADYGAYDTRWIEYRAGNESGFSQAWAEIRSGNFADYYMRWSELERLKSQFSESHSALVSSDFAVSAGALASRGFTVSEAALVSPNLQMGHAALLSAAWQVKVPSLVTVVFTAKEQTLVDFTSQFHVSSSADEYNALSKVLTVKSGSLIAGQLTVSLKSYTEVFNGFTVRLDADEYNKLVSQISIKSSGLTSNVTSIASDTLQPVQSIITVTSNASEYNVVTSRLCVTQSALLQSAFVTKIDTLQAIASVLTSSHAASQYNALKSSFTCSTSSLLSGNIIVSLDTRSPVESQITASHSADEYNKLSSTVTVTSGSLLSQVTSVSEATLQPVTPVLVVQYDAEQYNKLASQLGVTSGSLVTGSLVTSSGTLQGVSSIVTASLAALQYIPLSTNVTVTSASLLGSPLLVTEATLQPVYNVLVSSESIRTPVSSVLTITTEATQRNNLSVVITNTSSTEPENIVLSNLETYILHKGTRYEIIDLVLRDDFDSYAWNGSLELAQKEAYQALKIGELFTLFYLGQTFELMVQKRSLSRDNPVQPRLNIDVISPTALLDKPFNTADISEEFTANTASTIANSIASIDWQLIDWTIPSGRLAVQNATPIEALSVLVDSVGGMLATDRDGNLSAIPKFKAMPWQWSLANVDEIFTDYADNLAYSESYQGIDGYTEVTISDVEEDRQWDLSFESDPLDNTRGTLILKVYPWCESVDIVHTSQDAIVIKPLGVKIWSPSDDNYNYETVEFKENKASTQYPIYQINSYQYTHKNLGSMEFIKDYNEIRTQDEQGYSVARIHYLTRDMRWEVSGMLPEETTQFLAVIEE